MNDIRSNSMSPPSDDPLELLLLRLRRTNISSADLAAAIRKQFDVLAAHRDGAA